MEPPHCRLRLRRPCWLALLCAAGWWLPALPGAPGEETTIHRVRAGDTIPRLCWQYKVRSEAIRAANPGVGDPLPVGRKLTIPLGHYAPPPSVVHAGRTTTQPPKPPPPPDPAAVAIVPLPTPRAPPRPRQAATPPRAVVTTTRLPPQPPETPAPVRRPVTVISAERPQP